MTSLIYDPFPAEDFHHLVVYHNLFGHNHVILNSYHVNSGHRNLVVGYHNRLFYRSHYRVGQSHVTKIRRHHRGLVRRTRYDCPYYRIHVDRSNYHVSRNDGQSHGYHEGTENTGQNIEKIVDKCDK